MKPHQRIKRTRHVKKKALPLYVFSFFMIMPFHALLPLLPLIRDEISASYSQISIFLASLGIVRLILALPSGFLADHFNKKNVTVETTLSYGFLTKDHR